MMIQLLTSFTGSLGFCLVFHLRRRYLLPASLGGVLTCGVYLAAASALDGILLPTLIASAFAALYAEVLAWLLRPYAAVFDHCAGHSPDSRTVAVLCHLLRRPAGDIPCQRLCRADRRVCVGNRFRGQSGMGLCQYAAQSGAARSHSPLKLPPQLPYLERFQHETHSNKSEAAQQSLCRFAFTLDALSVTGEKALPIRTQRDFRPALPHVGYPAGDAAAAFCDGTAFPRSSCRKAPRSCSRQSVPGAGVP